MARTTTPPTTTTALLSHRASLTQQLRASPYDLMLYLERAAVHSELGYPDLAAGDAFKALLLTDEVRDEGFEFHGVAREALEGYMEGGERGRGGETGAGVEELLERACVRCYRVLAISLLLCGCLKSAYEFCLRGLERAPGDEKLVQAREYILNLVRRRLKRSETAVVDVDDFPDQGLVRREVYPWNEYEPDRYSKETLDFLNAELAKVAPKCVAAATEMPALVDALVAAAADGQVPMIKQLGLFAKEDIGPMETVLHEASALTVNNWHVYPLCDACSADLPDIGSEKQGVPCEECQETMFCSATCHDFAMETYHPAVCDRDVDSIAKNGELSEAPNMLYLLLLGRSLAMAATQDVHPLQLKEVRYIWGDFLPTTANAVPVSPQAGPPPVWTLPFSLRANISGPLDMLEKMDIDIYASVDRYDLWIFNTLYAKFRGTASARANKHDGRPEVAAVHPLWCLANHDCDPNVQWEWGGRMKLWTREKRFEGGKRGGVARGEEILSHYCDIRLPVQERREWAKGSLGGVCMCARCKREAGEEMAVLNGRKMAAVNGVKVEAVNVKREDVVATMVEMVSSMSMMHEVSMVREGSSVVA